MLKRLVLEGEVPLTVETTADGAIALRQAMLVPIEAYSDDRIKQLEQDSRSDPKPLAAARRLTRMGKHA